MIQPDYKNASVDNYRELLNDEAFLIQTIEALTGVGQYQEAKYLTHCKKFITIRRKCMKAALKKQKARQRYLHKQKQTTFL